MANLKFQNINKKELLFTSKELKNFKYKYSFKDDKKDALLNFLYKLTENIKYEKSQNAKQLFLFNLLSYLKHEDEDIRRNTLFFIQTLIKNTIRSDKLLSIIMLNILKNLKNEKEENIKILSLDTINKILKFKKNQIAIDEKVINNFLILTNFLLGYSITLHALSYNILEGLTRNEKILKDEEKKNKFKRILLKAKRTAQKENRTPASNEISFLLNNLN